MTSGERYFGIRVLLMGLLVATLVGCGDYSASSLPKGAVQDDLNRRVDLGPTPSTSEFTTKRKSVLIYYANEPNVEAYSRVRQWLSEKPGADYAKVVTRIDNDLTTFPKTVSDEVRAIQEMSPADLGAVIFTNTLANRGVCLVKQIGEAKFVEMPIGDAEENRQKYGLHPLTLGAMFETALRRVSVIFPPDRCEYVLVAKSHGSEEFAMATLLGQVLESKSSEEMFTIIEKYLAERGYRTSESGKVVRIASAERNMLSATAHDSLSPTAHDSLSPTAHDSLSATAHDSLNASSNDSLNASSNDSLNASSNDSLSASANDSLSASANDSLSASANDSLSASANDSLSASANDSLSPTAHDSLSPTAHDSLSPTAHDSLSPTAHDSLGGKILLSGLTKEEFLNLLLKSSRDHQLHFPVLFLESCRSELPTPMLEKLQASASNGKLGSLYTSDKSGLRYSTIDYSQLFKSFDSKQIDFAEAVRRFLDKVQAEQVPMPVEK